MAFQKEQIAQLLSLVRKHYPEWNGFSDPAFEADEVTYKQATVTKARSLLARGELEALLADGKADEVLKRFEKIGRDNNLLFQSVPLQSDLSVLYHEHVDKAAFARQLIDLAHGDGPGDERLGRYVAFLEATGVPQSHNTWTFPTYFLFICHPDAEMLVKPVTMQKFLELASVPEKLPKSPTPESYRAVCAVADSLRTSLAEYKPRDMVDIQSFIWTCVRAAAGEATQDKHAEFRSLFQEFLSTYCASTAGKSHAARYAAGREAGRANYRRIITEASANRDITDQVLLKLLPHADTAGNRERQAWIHIAPAITKDAKQLFEGAGWVRKEDWPEVAAAILRFLQRCEENPDDLADACAEFASSPYSKGLKAGMLSPILNALNPEAFLLVNDKAYKVVDHFSGKKHSRDMAAYPAIVATEQSLIQQFGDTLSSANLGTGPADTFDMFIHWLVAEKRYFKGSEQPPQYWKIAPGAQAHLWPQWLEGGYMSIGWDELGDVSGLTKAEFDQRLAEEVPKHEDWTKAGAAQVWTFAKQIKVGDRVLANRGISSVIGTGTVTGDYYFVPGVEHGHRIPVKWEPCHITVDEPGFQKTLVKLSEERFEQLTAAETVPVTKNPPYPLEELVLETSLAEDLLRRWIGAIERKKQAVLYGPPGTGKTFVAERLAKHLIGGGDGFAETVQFHPSYAYEDFIQGIRPVVRPDGALEYALVPGRFLDFCRRAGACTGRCVLIVDEINRANLSRVFGELMFLLEYRKETIPLAGGGVFSIPENVRLIGTMNTADRTIALVDHALRRRFAFLGLFPDFDILRRYHADNGFNADGLIQLLHELNRQINDRHYEVGISYFLREDLSDQIEDIWRMEIEPYLEEYFFDQPEKYQDYRWEKVRSRVLP